MHKGGIINNVLWDVSKRIYVQPRELKDVSMLIKGTAITVTYKRISGLKKIYYDNEDILRQYFNEATALPVPDDAPDEIPRIIVKTLHEHAQLNITPIASTLQIFYDEGFEQNWRRCMAYIMERTKVVFQFLNIFTNNQYDYIGVVSNVLMDQITVGGAKILARNLLKTQDVDRIYDLDIKYTFVEEDRIFVNILLQNARLFENETMSDQAGELGPEKQVAESIGAVIDINDRYGFNTIKDYHTDSDMLECLLGKMTDIIGDKLQRLVERGVY